MSIHVKCTLLNSFRFGAHGENCMWKSITLLCLKPNPPFPVSKMVSGFILICIYQQAQRTWYSVWDTGCSFPDCGGRLSRENKGGNSVPFKEGKQVHWASSTNWGTLALSKPRQRKRSQRCWNKLSLELSVNKISSLQSRHLDLEGEIHQKSNEAH